ncbi:SHOCT domain-containing protein [Streptococcus mutans]|uniref:SHOCT domain-containing protein n=1 Tax=Streptococcus mutans TaxID=1309 RepID=UPI00355AED7A
MRKGVLYMEANKLIRYSIQLAFLKQLLEKKLITDKEYSLIKKHLMKDYLWYPIFHLDFPPSI